MRAVLISALVLSLFGMNSAGATARYRDLIDASGQQNFAAASEFRVWVNRPDLEFAVPGPGDRPDSSGDDTDHQDVGHQDVGHQDMDHQSTAPQPPAADDADKAVASTTKPSVTELCDRLFAAATENGLPVPFFANLLWQESGLQLDIVSRAGARGIAQFMPEVAAEVGLRDPFDARQAIPASARFLHDLREQFHNLGLTAAAYNAGSHRVSDWLDHGRTLPEETRNYVKSVTGHSAEAWRKSPVADSELTFVQVLPCRSLPAFANLERTQNRVARAVPRPLPPLEALGEKIEQIATAAQKVLKTIATGIAGKADTKAGDRKAVAFRHNAAESKVAAAKPHDKIARNKAETKVAEAKVAAAKASEKLARNLHDAKHETPRSQHGSREKRKVALR
jgi:Transglycosylase SLT domain